MKRKNLNTLVEGGGGVLARGEADLRHHDPLGAEVEVDGGEAAAVRHRLVEDEGEVASEARVAVAVSTVVIGSEDQILLSEVLPPRVAKEKGRFRGGLKKGGETALPN